MNAYSVLRKYLVCMTFLTNELAYSVNSCMCAISLVLYATPYKTYGQEYSMVNGESKYFDSK
jgi:hypothetical protein